MVQKPDQFDFLAYLAQISDHENGSDKTESGRIPSLNELSEQVGVSIASLREQLGVARALGLVEVRPKTGIRRLPYRFAPAVTESLTYAIARDRKYFDDYSDLRKHIEADFWYQAIPELTEEDKLYLNELIDKAWTKLNGNPVRLPHQEHRELHLCIFSRLDNIFVQGLLEAYWDAYEEVGLNRYEELDYLKKVWEYHRKIVANIISEDYEAGHRLLLEHMDLINYREPIIKS